MAGQNIIGDSLNLVRSRIGARIAEIEDRVARLKPVDICAKMEAIRGMRAYLGITAAPLYCTRTASRLVRTYTDRHGLKDLVKELLGHDLSKQQQTSDWGAAEINDAQREYAASDVRYLHRLKEGLDIRLQRENRVELAEACFDFIPARALLDLAGWAEVDIFAHAVCGTPPTR